MVKQMRVWVCVHVGVRVSGVKPRDKGDTVSVPGTCHAVKMFQSDTTA